MVGCFYGTEDSDYQRAWQTLERRFGHPFRIQEAFREKLNNWPKLNNKDNTGLQRYADFLRSCQDAMPHIQGLRVLNDCKENQKLASKLPDHLIQGWSRTATDYVDSLGEYPDFSRFVAFVERETRVACDPIASFAAIKGQPSSQADNVKVRTLASGAETTTEEKEGSGNHAKKCPYCKGSHYLPNCKDFMSKSPEEKTTFIRKSGRCFGCLRSGHISKECASRHKCNICQKLHPTVLHQTKETNQQETSSDESNDPQETGVSLSICRGSSNTTNVVPVWISTKENPQVERLIYALLDTQSDSTFIDENVCSQLDVPREPVRLNLTTLLGKDVSIECQKVRGLRVRGYTSPQFVDLPDTYTRDFIPLDREHIPTRETAQKWKHLKPIVSEMPSMLDIEVGLLIGYNCSAALVPRQVIAGPNNEPYAVKSDLGWSIVGTSDTPGKSIFCHRVSLKEVPTITPRDALNLLEDDFKDINQDDKTISQNDIQFLETLEGSIRTNKRGHLEMPLPFKTRPLLPNNRSAAVTRLSHLQRRLEKDLEYKEEYTRFIQKMIDDGDCEPVSGDATPGETWYIPHHGVIHPQKQKLRVVFDCSAKFAGTSLNDHLLQGPDLMNNMFGILCRFRQNQFAIACDIEKMFHRFHVSSSDRDYLRFLWWKGGDTTSKPIEYRMNVHLFGAVSSPGCANFALKHLAMSHKKEFPRASSFLHDDFYMDDGLTSVARTEEAKTLINEAIQSCARKQIRLHKFISNEREVIQSIPTSERATAIQNIDLAKGDLPAERTLGIHWDIEKDCFSFQFKLKEVPNTRRGVLSTVASIYDPMGFISPFVLLGKSILQEMCKRGTSWDDPIPENLEPRWEAWKTNLKDLWHIKVPRCFMPKGESALANKIELHHFCDASSNGYGTCTYLRVVTNNQVHCTLIASKARVAPTKRMTIPRLELTAAVVAAKLAHKIRKELSIEITEEHYWSDSQVALAYINNEASRFHLFVANRVQLIREITCVDHWHYIPTTENPADLASRGSTVEQLINSNWFTGPDFLKDVNWKCPIGEKPKLIVGDPEIKGKLEGDIQSASRIGEDTETSLKARTECITVATEIRACDLLERLTKYSSWDLVLRIVARILRLSKGTPRNEPITFREKQNAESRILKMVQEESFSPEIRALNLGNTVPSTSKLQPLDPNLQDGLMRVGGRLGKSTLSNQVKHPIILPKNNHFTKLIISHYHEHHQGTTHTLNSIRSHGYWIVLGSKAVERFLKDCVMCRKLRRPVEQQKMADLPKERVEPSPPFCHIGMDCFGPFLTRNGRKNNKRYGLLFTCLCLSRCSHRNVT